MEAGLPGLSGSSSSSGSSGLLAQNSQRMETDKNGDAAAAAERLELTGGKRMGDFLRGDNKRQRDSNYLPDSGLPYVRTEDQRFQTPPRREKETKQTHRHDVYDKLIRSYIDQPTVPMMNIFELDEEEAKTLLRRRRENFPIPNAPFPDPIEQFF